MVADANARFIDERYNRMIGGRCVVKLFKILEKLHPKMKITTLSVLRIDSYIEKHKPLSRS